MSPVLAAFLAVCACALVAVLLAIGRRVSAQWVDDLTGRRVVVHLSDGTSLDGHLTSVDRYGLTLQAAKVLDDDDGVEVSGSSHIHRDRVAWVQAP